MLIQNIKIATDALIFSHSTGVSKLLLVTRKYDPNQGMWAFPGGFVDDDEELEAAALRELHEETGLLLPSLKQLHTFGKVGRDPRGRTVSVVYYGFADEHAHHIAGGDDAATAAWVPLHDITQMAFDHKEVLDICLGLLAGELEGR